MKRKLLETFMENRPIQCEKCHGKLFYTGSGKYNCAECGHEMMDDFGKIKDFLERNGPSPMLIIADATGVNVDVIDYFLRKGRIEIIEGSQFYINCEKCGCSIRYGRFCPDCVKQLATGIKTVFEEMGEKPKKLPTRKAMMHFLSVEKKYE